MKPHFAPDANPLPAGDGGAAGGGQGSQQPDKVVVDKETEELKGLLATETPDDKQKQRLTELQSRYNIEYVGEDGKPLSPAQIKASQDLEKRVNGILAKDEDKRTPDEKKFLEDNTTSSDTRKFYEIVDDLSGVKHEGIEYGDTDPHSPEGAIIREQHIHEQGARAYETDLKANFPMAYQFLTHLQNGGNEADFFKENPHDFTKITLDKDNKTQQERILRIALSMKGNSPDVIDAVVTSMKDSAKLFEVSSAELEALQKGQKEKAQNAEAVAKASEAKMKKDLIEMSNALDTSVEKGIDGLVIPAAKRKDFHQFVVDRIRYQNGRFAVLSPFEPKELNKVLKTAYFDFMGGDITGLVSRTEATKRALVIKGAAKQQITPKSSGSTTSRKVPLGDL